MAWVVSLNRSTLYDRLEQGLEMAGGDPGNKMHMKFYGDVFLLLLAAQRHW